MVQDDAQYTSPVLGIIHIWLLGMFAALDLAYRVLPPCAPARCLLHLVALLLFSHKLVLPCAVRADYFCYGIAAVLCIAARRSIDWGTGCGCCYLPPLLVPLLLAYWCALLLVAAVRLLLVQTFAITLAHILVLLH